MDHYTRFQPGEKPPSRLVGLGTDVISLTHLPGAKNLSYRGDISLNSNTDPFTPLLGLGLSNVTLSPNPSILETLLAAKLINNLSWSYTAGNYKSLANPNATSGSLVLGGFDTGICDFRDSKLSATSEFSVSNAPNNATSRYLRLKGLDITVHAMSTYNSNFEYQQIANGVQDIAERLGNTPAIFDTTTPFIHLPVAHANGFARVVNLTWDSNLQYYPVTNQQAEWIQKYRPDVNLTLFGDTYGNSVTINLDLRSLIFDLKPGRAPSQTSRPSMYLAVMRLNPDQSTIILGRSILQRTCLGVNFSDRRMYITQASEKSTTRDGVVEFSSIGKPTSKEQTSSKSAPGVTNPESGSSGMVLTAIIAGSVGGFVSLCLAIWLWCCCRRKKKRKRKQELAEKQQKELRENIEEEIREKYGLTKTELSAESSITTSKVERSPSPIVAELDSQREERIVEVAGDSVVHELDATSLVLEVDGVPQSRIRRKPVEKSDPSNTCNSSPIRRRRPTWGEVEGGVAQTGTRKQVS